MVISTVKSQTYDTTFYNEDSGLTQWHVTQMLQDHNGMMWFSTWNGLNRFDGKEFIAFKSKAGDGSNMPTDRIRDMILAKNNDIYCRVDETWYRFSQKDGKFYNLTVRANRILNSVSHRQTKFMKGKEEKLFEMYDRQGNLWCIMKNGIQKLTPSHSPVKQLDQVGHSSQIRAFFKDHKGQIWISSREEKCIYLFDRSLHFKKSIPIQASAYTIAEDAQGQILLGCKPEGLLIGNENGFQRCSPPLDIYDIVTSSHEPTWIASFQGIFQLQGGKLTSWLPPTAPQMRFRKIFRKGNVLLGATTEGLFVADIKNKKFILHQKEANRVNSMSSSACMNILEHQGHLYIATESGGVNEILNTNLLDKQLRFRHFDMSMGLASDIALSMVSLGNNILIVSSNKLIILNPQTGKSRSLSKHFLQRSCRFSDATPIRLADGRWLLGLQDGAIQINEKALQGSRFRPYLALTAISIENHPTLYHADALNKITLQTDERTLSLSFAALDYSDPHHILYAYRLADDTEWHYLGHNRTITLPELKPGDYELLIQSTNADGTWSNNTRKLSIHVTPKFTETIWFTLLNLLTIITILAIGGYTYYYIKRMKSQQRETLEAYLALLHTEEQEQKTAQEKTSKPQLSEQDDAIMKRVMTFVEEHIGDTDAGVSEMAEAALMSKSNLTRKLKELIGLTPGDFLKEARIKKATELLKNTNMNISEIAYMCGFNDPKYFSKVFKSSIGKTPSEYRE